MFISKKYFTSLKSFTKAGSKFTLSIPLSSRARSGSFSLSLQDFSTSSSHSENLEV